MNEPQMAALLVAHDRPGFYFRVLEEGEVGAGDEIVKVVRGPESMTVAEINALLYKPGHPADRLERALRIPALSAGWRGSLRRCWSRRGAPVPRRAMPGLPRPPAQDRHGAGFAPCGSRQDPRERQRDLASARALGRTLPVGRRCPDNSSWCGCGRAPDAAASAAQLFALGHAERGPLPHQRQAQRRRHGRGLYRRRGPARRHHRGGAPRAAASPCSRATDRSCF